MISKKVTVKISDGWKFEQVTSLKAVDEVRNNSGSGNEFLLVLSRRSTLPESTLNLHQGKKIGKVNIFRPRYVSVPVRTCIYTYYCLY